VSKRGLPNTLRMRHDEHYVETLAASAGAPVGKMVPIELLDPNPGQPRQVMGDLSELMASITEKGVIERHADDAEVMELALIENLQRKDLTAFEEAEALQQLAQKCRYTHEDMARKLGRSRTAITEALALNGMPEEVRNLCRLADITSKSTLLQVVRQATPQKMLALVEKMVTQGALTRKDVRAETSKERPSRPRPFVFAFRAPSKAFRLRLSFTKSRVDKGEIIEALENILRDLRASRN
jgi:ParB family chromosome partitioning protein